MRTEDVEDAPPVVIIAEAAPAAEVSPNFATLNGENNEVDHTIDLSSLFINIDQQCGELKVKLDEISNRQNEFKVDLEKMIKNQDTLLNRVAKLKVKFKEFIKAFGGLKQTTCEPEKSVLISEPFEPINTLEQLQKLENELKEKKNLTHT